MQQIAGIAGTTSRTLRHYDTIGLLKPSRTGGNGCRFYDMAALVRLQRILLLRDLGLGLPGIAGVLASEPVAPRAPGGHLAWLTAIPGTPAAASAAGGSDFTEYLTGLGEMYVADPRFAATYGGIAGASFVRDALRIHAAKQL
ncbi:DNA-binding transcriptional MerR regulator [Arthrobacter sp. MP_M7]|nr:DNA-binding transcriptional MerR regulator [Arthrobacter sp. MP_M4]MEC5201317.1 DNA-binding transcriptional MerR regulator [Arthrobacter sp. MP_M7]